MDAVRDAAAVGWSAARVATLALVVMLSAACTDSPGADPGSTPVAEPGWTPSSTPAAPGPDTGRTPDPRPDPTPDPTPDPRPAARTVSLLVSGDVLLHAKTWRTARADARRTGAPGFDFAPMLAAVAPAVRAADLAVCHLETPLAPAAGPFANYPAFSVPPQVVPALRSTGFDACTTASNHSLDRGAEGLARTLDTLDAGGVAHDGTARSRREQRRPLVLRAGDGVRVAVLSYTFGTNGIPLPAGRPWAVSLVDSGRVVRDAEAARRAGADVVAVALHAGTEYVTAPDDYQTDVVDEITRSPDVDVVFGHHAHVPQPIDRVNGTWVAYGLGNFVAGQQTAVPLTYRGVTVRFELTERPGRPGRPGPRSRRGGFAVSDIGYLPTMITGADPADPTTRVLDVRAALDDPRTARRLRPSLRATLAGVRADVLSAGADRLDSEVHVHLLRR